MAKPRPRQQDTSHSPQNDGGSLATTKTSSPSANSKASWGLSRLRLVTISTLSWSHRGSSGEHGKRLAAPACAAEALCNTLVLPGNPRTKRTSGSSMGFSRNDDNVRRLMPWITSEVLDRGRRLFVPTQHQQVITHHVPLRSLCGHAGLRIPTQSLAQQPSKDTTRRAIRATGQT